MLAFPLHSWVRSATSVWPKTGGALSCSLKLFLTRGTSVSGAPPRVGGVWGLAPCGLCCHSLGALLPLLASVLTSEGSINPARAEVRSGSVAQGPGMSGAGVFGCQGLAPGPR